MWAMCQKTNVMILLCFSNVPDPLMHSAELSYMKMHYRSSEFWW